MDALVAQDRVHVQGKLALHQLDDLFEVVEERRGGGDVRSLGDLTALDKVDVKRGVSDIPIHGGRDAFGEGGGRALGFQVGFGCLEEADAGCALLVGQVFQLGIIQHGDELLGPLQQLFVEVGPDGVGDCGCVDSHGKKQC